MTNSAEDYRRLRRKMVLFLERRCCWEAEEVADEALYRAFARYNSERFPSIEAFAFGVLRKVYLEWLRRTRRSAPLNEDANVAADHEPEIWQDLRNALAELSPQDKELLEEFYVGGHTANEVAPRYGLSPEGIRSKLKRLRDALSARLRPEIAESEKRVGKLCHIPSRGPKPIRARERQ